MKQHGPPRYCVDVFGRAAVAGFYDIRDLDKMVMPSEQVRAFIVGAKRLETTDPVTGWTAIAYEKDGQLLIYDTIKPPDS